MTEKEREQVALFRYGLIAPLLNGQVDQKEYLMEQAGKNHSIPYYGERKIAPKTIQEWLLNYRRNGFNALKPKKRADRGNSRRLSPDDQDQILEIRKRFLHMPVSVFYEQLIAQGEITKNQISYSSINRLLKKHNLVGKSILASPERKRFAHDKVNVLWQTDLSHGPYLSIDGKAQKTFLIAYIDDCSRLVPYAEFFTSEKFDGLRIVTKEAIIRRGKPTMIYADNGKIYRSETLQYACAQMGITLTHTRPYDPQSKGATVCRANGIEVNSAEAKVAERFDELIDSEKLLEHLMLKMQTRSVENKDQLIKHKNFLTEKIVKSEERIHDYNDKMAEEPELADVWDLAIMRIEDEKEELASELLITQNKLKEKNETHALDVVSKLITELIEKMKSTETNRQLKELYLAFIDEINWDKETFTFDIKLYFNEANIAEYLINKPDPDDPLRLSHKGNNQDVPKDLPSGRSFLYEPIEIWI